MGAIAELASTENTFTHTRRFTCMDFLYCCGVFFVCALNARLKRDTLLKPACEAMAAMERSEPVSNRQAFFMRTSVSACLSVLPVACLKKRQKELSVMARRPAICRVDTSS